MIHSMTAFARNEANTPWAAITWELRSVNHRYLDITVRFPDELRSLEPQVRERIRNNLQRGKVECLLHYKPVSEQKMAFSLDHDLARQIANAAREVSAHLSAATPIDPMDILRWPGVMEPAPLDIRSVSPALLDTLDTALLELIATRSGEGKRLAELINTRCAEMTTILQRIRQRLPTILTMQRDRILTRLAELKVEPNTDRLEQELVFLTQKIDIAEETDRLDTHIAEVERLLHISEKNPGQRKPVGRRLDFLMQEMHREANTLSAKSVDGETTSASVELRVLIEQMREQVQNIE
uniref:TIGR00255 family protein n=1 Tax=Candidatus Kentrum sp. MB TaxID=2138164 RepID=A0A450X877_9GAMM|nr:MAG: TIGR00255 family protein [Candidatus Kentron sp. MB]VFK29128.1 MAG: TIGR00255 family protein [Candidatus Kentron sp. MB]VFK74681.1 MAG: TIGR00255 family protein [Candidatus Kentron sp. MB]